MPGQPGVIPGQVHDLIDQVRLGRRDSEGAPFNLPQDPAATSTSSTAAGNEASTSQGLLSVPKLPSYPSTVYDRGDSERLKSIEVIDDETAFGHIDDIVGTGTWPNAEVRSLEIKLRDALVPSIDGKEFLPLKQLGLILTDSAVEQELLEKGVTASVSASRICNRQEYMDDHQRVCYTSCQKIFATLVLIDQVQLISDFLEEGFRDVDLPLKIYKAHRNAQSLHALVRQTHDGQPASAYRLQTSHLGWTPNIISHFETQQWIVSAPYFATADELRQKVHFYALSSKDVMPFITYVGNTNGHNAYGNRSFLHDGAFSTVYPVKIHADHHNFPVERGNLGADFAVKKLEAVGNSKENFDREVEALKKFSQKNERYIIKLLATYEIGGVYHLLFPVADGNLRTFWKTYKWARDFPNAALWLARESHGIATALQKIHILTRSHQEGPNQSTSGWTVHGIHGDIKPQNVLWFKILPSHLPPTINEQTTASTPGDLTTSGLNTYTKRFGYLQMSDFGTVDFHRSSSANQNTIRVQRNTYRAPESHSDPYEGGSPAIDIWALGCLYLDCITWYIRGFKGVEEDFVEARTLEESPDGELDVPEDKFFICKRNWWTGEEYIVVKRNVLEWISHLHSDPGCSPFIHDFLDFIETRMLVVPREDRCKCDDVVEKLDTLFKKCRYSRDYCEAGSVRTWASLESRVLVLKAHVRRLGRVVNSNGLMVCGVAMCLLFVICILMGKPKLRYPALGDFSGNDIV
ncbi:kinase-like domain-containing protein [Xylariales sp. AK1849]|nr:kinase-like domain-containing protein [Xylariales sp. AK1849]